MTENVQQAIRNIATELREQVREKCHSERRRRLGINLMSYDIVMVRRDDLEELHRYATAAAKQDCAYDPVCDPVSDKDEQPKPANDWLEFLDNNEHAFS